MFLNSMTTPSGSSVGYANYENTEHNVGQWVLPFRLNHGILGIIATISKKVFFWCLCQVKYHLRSWKVLTFVLLE